MHNKKKNNGAKGETTKFVFALRAGKKPRTNKKAIIKKKTTTRNRIYKKLYGKRTRKEIRISRHPSHDPSLNIWFAGDACGGMEFALPFMRVRHGRVALFPCHLIDRARVKGGKKKRIGPARYYCEGFEKHEPTHHSYTFFLSQEEKRSFRCMYKGYERLFIQSQPLATNKWFDNNSSRAVAFRGPFHIFQGSEQSNQKAFTVSIRRAGKAPPRLIVAWPFSSSISPDSFLFI